MPTCPVCTSSRHDTWGGVAVHIWKKQDEQHDMADSKDEATIWLAQNGHIKADTSPAMSDPDDDPAQATDGSGTSSAAEGVEFPENPDSTDEGGETTPETTDPECPACGSDEIADAQAVLRNQAGQLSGEYRRLLADSDYVCAACGGVFDDD